MMKLTRRHVVALVAALPASSAMILGIRWWNRGPAAGFKILSQDEAEFVRALAEAWMPPGGSPSLSGAEANLDVFFDEILTSIPSLDAKGLKLLMQALDDLTLLSHGSSYRNLPLKERSHVLREWITSETALLRSALTALIVLFSEAYFFHPEVRSHTSGWYACGYGSK